MAMTNVCVVEDDPDIRETVRDLLADAGYSVVEAANGLEGLRILEGSVEPLVAVIDYRLPALNGCDLLETVANDAQLQARHTFIMMSASPQKTLEDCEDAIDDLDVPIVPKPFDIDQLLDAVREASERLDPGAAPTSD